MSSGEAGFGPDGLSAGKRLAQARTTAGLSIVEVAAQTRIPARHLISIEADDYRGLPGRSYAIGFAKTFARAVGENEAEIGAAVALEYAASAPAPELPATPAFAPGDPARVPSSRIVWLAAAALAVVGIGGFAWWQHTNAGGGLPSILPVETPVAVVTTPAPVVPSAEPSEEASAVPSGPVVFTAQIDNLWVKFYDGTGKQLLQKQLAKGETYTVPADAVEPKIWTGRPDALEITIGGTPVPKLSQQDKRIKDVPVSAAALLARAKPEPVASPIPGATPSAAPSVSASPKPVRRIARPRVAKPEADGAPPPTAPQEPSTTPQ